MEKLIYYFSQRAVIVNVVLFGLILTAIMMWPKVGKEEMPDFAFNSVRVTIPYPGASSGDVELFITKPVEEKLKGVTSLEAVKSTSSYGVSSFQVSFELHTPNLQEKIQEVKDAIDSVDLPREAEAATYKQFRSSEKAILDVGLYLKDKEILDTDSRILLQKYALAFKDRLLSLKEVSGVTSEGYLRPELQVKVKPERLKDFEVSMDQVQSQITQQHVRRPIGSMKDRAESDVSLIGELDDVASLEQVIVSSGFSGQQIHLSELADVDQGFERNKQIVKISGNEGLVYNVQKSSNVDILSAQEAVLKFIKQFELNNADIPIGFVLMDDESYDVRNRLSLISYNGLIGFSLILIILFIFLDFRSGIWVGMGIPFCLAFTLIVANLLDFTINNITLASIIIVLGIVVDDAIIVAENISRREMNGMSLPYVKGTIEVMNPIIASVLTTCAAFVPLYFFSGRFGLFVQYIPTIIFLMLFSSLIESFFILPAHMRQNFSWSILKEKTGKIAEKRAIFLNNMENSYSVFLEKILKKRVFVLLGFCLMLIGALWVFDQQLNYVMFPREESKEFRIKVKVNDDTVRYETARIIRQVENVFLNDKHHVVVGVRSSVGQSNRGGQVAENEASLVVEIVPRDERDISLNELLKIWQTELDQLKGFSEIKIVKSRWGSDSGSPIEIQIQENNDNNRRKITEKLKEKLEALPELANVEIERPIEKQEFELSVKKVEVSRLNVDYMQLASTLRSYIEGSILYTLNSGEEEIDVRFTSLDKNKDDIERILDLSVANKEGYLIPIRNLVNVKKQNKPANIQRINFKRTTTVYADLVPDSEITPLTVAENIERDIFPELMKGVPSAILEFQGEVKDSRESQSDFTMSIILALSIIYFLLVFLFESLLTPLVIAAIIPFGLVGVIFMLWSHGMTQFGFFAVVGSLGMIGVVINDSIVMVDKLESFFESFNGSKDEMFEHVAKESASRLRAVILTTLTTVAGLLPTAYGIAGYDAMLAEMMLSMSWGLMFGMFITLLLTPSLYSFYIQYKIFIKNMSVRKNSMRNSERV